MENKLRLQRPCKYENVVVVGVLGLAPCHSSQKTQVHGGDQSQLPPLWNSFAGTGIHNGPVPPAFEWLEVLHCSDVTRTHLLAQNNHCEF